MAIPVGYVLLKFRFALVGDLEEMICTLGAETTATDFATRVALLDAAVGHWGTDIMPNFSSAYSLTGVDGIYGSGTGDLPHTSSITGPSGTLSNTPTQQNTSVLVKKLSGLGGRANRGRMFVPGCPEDQIGPTGLILGAHLANLQLAFTSLYDDLVATTNIGNLVIFHDDPAPLPTTITSLFVDPLVATQRRRLRR
jgi:hypothetical protein